MKLTEKYSVKNGINYVPLKNKLSKLKLEKENIEVIITEIKQRLKNPLFEYQKHTLMELYNEYSAKLIQVEKELNFTKYKFENLPEV
jgi:hypothetical protein